MSEVTVQEHFTGSSAWLDWTHETETVAYSRGVGGSGGSAVSVWDGLQGGYLVAVSLLAVLGNGTVLAVSWRQRRSLQQRTTRIFMASLAASDLLGALLVNLPNASKDLTGGWVLGRVACKAYGLTRSMLPNSSIITLCVISIDRYLNVSRPNKMVLSTRCAGLIMLVVWLYNTIVHLPVLWWNDIIKVGHMRNLCITSSAWGDVRYYALALTVLNFFVPLMVTWVAYLAIIHHMWLSRKRRVMRRVVKMCLIIVSIFTLMWTPFQVALLVFSFMDNSETRMAMVLTYLMAGAANVINPVVYSFMWPAFRANLLQWCPFLVRLPCCPGVVIAPTGSHLSSQHASHMTAAGSKMTQMTNTGPSTTEHI